MSHFNAALISGRNMTADGIKIDDIVTGVANTALGRDALSSVSGASQNTAVGIESMRDNVNGSNNTAVGYRTLQIATGVGFTGNTALGSQVMISVGTTASDNTGVGRDALASMTSGNFNTAIGSQSAQNITNASNNTGIGTLSLSLVTTGSSNTAVGISSGGTITTGSQNVMVGSSSTSTAATTSGTTVVGNGAIGGTNAVSLGNGAIASGTGSIAIGNGATATSTNSITIGNGGSNNDPNTVKITGEVLFTGNTAFSHEIVSVAGGASQNPSLTETISVVDVTGAGVATGTLADGVAIGQLKYIVLRSNVATGYVLTVTTGFEPGGGVLSTLTFANRGQGVTLVWVGTGWMILNGGAGVN